MSGKKFPGVMVIVKEKCFVQNGLREPGYPEPIGSFLYTGDPDKLPRSLVIADGSAAASVAEMKKEEKPNASDFDPSLTKAQIMVELTAAGVEYDHKANKPELLKLLEEAKKKAAPASSGAPDKSAGLPTT